eukprot:gene12372-54956_t
MGATMDAAAASLAAIVAPARRSAAALARYMARVPFADAVPPGRAC